MSKRHIHAKTKIYGQATMDHYNIAEACIRTQGTTATSEHRGLCVCLKEEEKKSHRYNVWQSQPSTAPDTESILSDTGLSGVKLEGQVRAHPSTFRQKE